LTRRCRGLYPDQPCERNCYKSSTYCGFHLWRLKHYIGINQANREDYKHQKYLEQTGQEGIKITVLKEES
jgi:hypothetical protein